ncbi:hypothetical protein D6783_03845, partial [Candidatus Woesearchaeota archaeon]
MNTVELLVYILFAFIIGSLIFGFISDWDYLKTYRSFRTALLSEPDSSFQTVTLDSLLAKLNDVRKQCVRREKTYTQTLYVEGNTTLTKEALFSRVKALHWCGSLQSASEGCGEREDVNVSAIPL